MVTLSALVKRVLLSFCSLGKQGQKLSMTLLKRSTLGRASILSSVCENRQTPFSAGPPDSYFFTKLLYRGIIGIRH
jgi:hypothetical protein